MHYERIMVFGAHPDDELRMASGMAKMASQGTVVTAVIFTDGCEGFPRVEMKEEIVALRAAEAEAVQKVLGVQHYVNLGAPDMGLENTKEMLRKVIEAIREGRPQAIFTHGEMERHRDHIATHELSLEALWHAGEPVSADLGPPWKTPHIYYYKNTAVQGPTVTYDVSDFAYIHPLAMATQLSQHTLFRTTKEECLAQAEKMKENPPQTVQRFVLHPWTTLNAFPPLP